MHAVMQASLPSMMSHAATRLHGRAQVLEGQEELIGEGHHSLGTHAVNWMVELGWHGHAWDAWG